MQKILLYVIFIMILKLGIIEAEKKEVLVRDRLLMILCDQMDEYMGNGKMPAAIKTMTEKYRHFKPGKGTTDIGKPAPAPAPASAPASASAPVDHHTEDGQDYENSKDPEVRGVLGGGHAVNEDGKISGNPNDPSLPKNSKTSGRKVAKIGGKEGRLVEKYGGKSRYSRHVTPTLQEDFKVCSEPGAECVLDLND